MLTGDSRYLYQPGVEIATPYRAPKKQKDTKTNLKGNPECVEIATPRQIELGLGLYGAPKKQKSH